MTITDHDAFTRRRRALELQADELVELRRSGIVDGSGGPSPGALDTLLRGLTEIRIAEEELRAQSEELTLAYELLVDERERYRQLFEHAPVAYVVTDLEGRITACNLMAARMMGRERWRLLDGLFVTKVVAEDRECFRTVLREVAQGGQAGGRLHLANGGDPVHVTASASRSAGPTDASVQWILVPLAADVDDAGVRPLTLIEEPRPAEPAEPVSVLVLPAQGRLVDRLQRLSGDPRLSHVELRRPASRDPVAAILSARPDVVVVDLTAAAAPQWVATLREDFPDCPVLGLAPRDDDLLVLEAVDAGADVLVDPDDDRLRAAVLALHAGIRLLPAQLRRPMRDRVQHALLVEELGGDDRRLLQWVASGATTAQIGAELHVSARTVKRRVSGLMRRLDVRTRAELAGVAARAGLASFRERTIR